MKLRIEKNIYVRDRFKVKRQAFTAGQEVDVNEYNAVLSTNSVINPDDLPVIPKANKRSLASQPIKSVETKDLDVPKVEIVYSERKVDIPQEEETPYPVSAALAEDDPKLETKPKASKKKVEKTTE